MSFKIKIISPIKIDEVDLRRRRMRYGEHASAETKVEVFNLPDGPTTLDSPGDLLFCEHAVFQEGIKTDPNEFDAILIDCVFDPAVDALREQSELPTFGPMRATLPLVSQIANKFSYVARTERQTQWLAELATRYGYGDKLASSRALKISYQDSRTPKIFDEAMSRNMKQAVQEDGAEAIVMGSTTMAISDKVSAAAQGVPLFLPGMVSLRVMELLWGDGLLA